jgi:hypothetical protein
MRYVMLSPMFLFPLLALSSKPGFREMKGGTYGTLNKKAITTHFFSSTFTCILPKNATARLNTPNSVAQLKAIETAILISKFLQLFCLVASNI